MIYDIYIWYPGSLQYNSQFFGVKYHFCWWNLRSCTPQKQPMWNLPNGHAQAPRDGHVPHPHGPHVFEWQYYLYYLVGGWPTPLKNMSSSVGMMTFPINMESHKIPVPNHQPASFVYCFAILIPTRIRVAANKRHQKLPRANKGFSDWVMFFSLYFAKKNHLSQAIS